MKKTFLLLIVLIITLILLPAVEENLGPLQEKSTSIHWGGLGARLIENGVIDLEKFKEVYSARGGLRKNELELLSNENNTKLIISSENANFALSILWAFGLANKNEILEEGPMADPQYGSPGFFASTGGWTLAEGDTMSHYSAHRFIKLTPEQQRLVEEVSKDIYRPCCNNPTYFPDCNHGMAMLGLLELMASQGFSENQIYETAEIVNSFWFSGSYNSNCST